MLTSETEDYFKCSYCLRDKPVPESSDEHIWPDGLGGDPLGAPWRTDKVCRTCNSLAGQWVDGAFIKSWFGTQERRSNTEDYLDPAAPEKSVVPLVYMGTVEHAALEPEEAADVWLGPAGDTVLHVRPKHEAAWDTYAGGKPSRKKSEAGHAYLAFASPNVFWAHVTLWTFQRHFKAARRTLTNSDMPVMPSPLTPLDETDPTQARHLQILRSLSDGFKAQSVLSVDLGTRFLVKLALGVGREVFGETFLETRYATHLSTALWERDIEKRRSLPVRGSGFLGDLGTSLGKLPIAWSGGWLLMLMSIGGLPSITVLTPSGKAMTILVSDVPMDGQESGAFGGEGSVYLAIPAAGEAAGPISLPNYLAFMTGDANHEALARLKALRRDPGKLPAKR